MPLTAIHTDSGGLLDTSLPDLGSEVKWGDIHRARPPVPLTCRACGAPMAAKASQRGMRFFAHRAAASDCPTLGESMAHRLLKLELVNAARAAGWIAELEVAGNGWRADVLAISRDGSRRIAWEAQLASANVDELRERTERMASNGVEACWVTDRDAPWVTQVPSVRIQRLDSEPSDGLVVVDRHAVFRSEWCGRRTACTYRGAWGRGDFPCFGYGKWTDGPAISLSKFVIGVCNDMVHCHTLVVVARSRDSRHRWGPLAWTTGQHLTGEQEQLNADQRCEQYEAKRRAEALAHERRIQALMDRQPALILPMVELAFQQTRTYSRVDDGNRESRFAKGVPVYVDDKMWAVICPRSIAHQP